MALNTPEFQILKDNDKEATIKVVGYFSSACSAAFPFVANTLLGANTAAGRNCISSITNMLYTTSMANGRVSLEFISTVNANVKALTVGHFNDGELNKYVINNANTPTGDYSVNVESAGPNDSFTLIFTVNKENAGVPGNAQNYGAGSWANCFTWQ